MVDAVPPRSQGVSSAHWTVAGILGLLIITAVSIVPLTLTIIQLRQSDALVIDLAGRQRMLFERYMKELLLASDGIDTPYWKTREVLRERVTALMDGGSTIGSTDETSRIALPPAPTEEIRNKLLQQERLMKAFMAKADRFLATPRSAKEYSRLRDDLLEDNASLLNVSNEVVVLLTKHSEARVTRLIGWEVIAVFLIVAVASIRTWQFVQTENALARSQSMVMDALRQRDAVKSSLLSSVSHELRTPLTAIKTMLFNLHEESVTQAATVRMEFLKSIDEELDYLNRLVGNLLDMSRIEAGTLKPNREWHLLDELIEVSIRRVGQRLERRSLHIDLSQDLPPIYVDGMEIQQVLVNLLDNAVKFSAEDSPISIQAGRQGDKITVQVTNQGEGIPHDELSRIFDRFYRVSARTISAVPGTGLGLAICKSIVEAHGGLIEARSISGQETTVSFSIPVMEGVPNHQRETTHA